MNKQEIKQVMAIVRPAIIALYGRQSLRLIRYNDSLAYQGHPLKSMYLRVKGTKGTYEVQFEKGRVTSLELAKVKE